MSTILNALRRLEEDDRPPTGSPADPLLTTDPHSANELRSRILAEESAAQAAFTERPDRDRFRRIAMMAAVAVVVIGLGAGADRLWSPTASNPTLAVLAAAPATPTSPITQPTPLATRVSAPTPSRAPLSPTVREQVVSSPEPTAVQSAAEAQPSIVPLPVPLPNPIVLDDSSDISAGNALASISSPDPSVAGARSGNSSAALAMPAGSDSAEEINPRAPSPTRATPAASKIPPRQKPPTPAATEIASASARPSSRPMPTNSPIDTPNVSAARPDYSSASSPSRSASESRPAEPAPTVRAITASSVEHLDARGLPEIVILRTAWHPNAERRSARIRLESTEEVMTLREGDAIGKLVIQSISPSSVLFKTGDIEIRRRVGQP